MIKVLHLANVGGQSRGGGVHEVAYNFFKYQFDLDIQPQLWFPGNKEEMEEFRQEKEITVMDTYGNPNWGFTKKLFEGISTDEFQIIHQHGIWLPNSLLSKKFRKKKKVPILIQPHGYLEPFRLKMSKLKKRIAYFAFEKENLNNCKLLLACSPPEAVNLKEMFPNKMIGTISNGIPNDFLNAEADTDYTDPFPDKRTMLFLSRIHPLKGLVRYLKIVNAIGREKLKNWGFVIAGFEEVNHEAELKTLVKKLDLDHFVKFVGPVFGQEKINLISSAELFVLPTFNENYGIVVAEALARETPVLTTKGTPWGELETHNCGFWADNNDQGIEQSLRSALEISEKDLKTMGKNGKKLIQEKYTWEKTTKDTKVLYDWILGGGDKPHFILD